MKKSILFALSLAFAGACSEDNLKVNPPDNDPNSFSFTNEEADSIIFTMTGRNNVQLEEKIKLLEAYVVQQFSTKNITKVKSDAGRVQTTFGVLITAGVYQNSTGTWDFSVKSGLNTERLSLTKYTFSTSSPATLGASGSVWFDNNSDGVLDVLHDTEAIPAYVLDNPNCDLISYARTDWNPPTYNPQGAHFEIIAGCGD